VVQASTRRYHPVRRESAKKYQDIYPFDFESEDWRALWAELKSVFEFWVAQGVKIFRVDNPHTKSSHSGNGRSPKSPGFTQMSSSWPRRSHGPR